MGAVEDAGDHALLRIGADDIHWLAGYLIGLGVPFEVIAPASLRADVMALAERIAEAHRGP